MITFFSTHDYLTPFDLGKALRRAYGVACDEIIPIPFIGGMSGMKGSIRNWANWRPEKWAYFTPSFFQRSRILFPRISNIGALLENALQKTLSPDDRRRVNEVKFS